MAGAEPVVVERASPRHREDQVGRRRIRGELGDELVDDELWDADRASRLAIEAYRQRGRLIIGEARNDTIARAVADWYRHDVLTGDVTSGLLIAYDNATVTELNHRARTHFAGSGDLTGPTVDVGERTYGAGDRILCRRNQSRLGVLNGDLGTVVAVDQARAGLMVRLDRDPETRNLPAWYSSRVTSTTATP